MQLSRACQAQMPRGRLVCVLFQCRAGIEGLSPNPTTSTFLWCLRSQQLDFLCTGLPFLILDHLLWLKAQLCLKCSVFSKMVFWSCHRKNSRNFFLHSFSLPLLCLKAYCLSNFTTAHKFFSTKLASEHGCLSLLLSSAVTKVY